MVDVLPHQMRAEHFTLGLLSIKDNLVRTMKVMWSIFKDLWRTLI